MTDSQISSIDDEPVVVKKRQKAEPTAELKGANKDDSMSGKYEILTVFSSNEDGGTNAVPVGINGYLYQIPRDKPFKVPTEVVEVLRQAVVTTYIRNPAGDIVPSDRPRHNFMAVPA